MPPRSATTGPMRKGVKIAAIDGLCPDRRGGHYRSVRRRQTSVTTLARLTASVRPAQPGVLHFASTWRICLENTLAAGRSRRTVILSTLAAATWAQAPASGPERVDLDAVYRIKDEGLAAVAGHGHALVPHRRARPAADQLAEHPRGRRVGDRAAERVGPDATCAQEAWGPFGRGWANEKFTANVVAPQPFPLIAFPRAWTPGTNGAVTADALSCASIDRRGRLQASGRAS